MPPTIVLVLIWVLQLPALAQTQIDPTEGLQHVGKAVRVRLVVSSIGRGANNMHNLNSEKSWRAPYVTVGVVQVRRQCNLGWPADAGMRYRNCPLKQNECGQSRGVMDDWDDHLLAKNVVDRCGAGCCHQWLSSGSS